MVLGSSVSLASDIDEFCSEHKMRWDEVVPANAGERWLGWLLLGPLGPKFGLASLANFMHPSGVGLSLARVCGGF